MTFLGVILDDFFFPKDGLLLPLTPHIITVLFVFLLIFNICITHTAAPGGNGGRGTDHLQGGQQTRGRSPCSKETLRLPSTVPLPCLSKEKSIRQIYHTSKYQHSRTPLLKSHRSAPAPVTPLWRITTTNHSQGFLSSRFAFPCLNTLLEITMVLPG